MASFENEKKLIQQERKKRARRKRWLGRKIESERTEVREHDDRKEKDGKTNEKL